MKWDQVEGLLKVKEHAGRGTMTTMVCGETLTLWSKDVDEWPCPCSLPFSIALPTVFSDERGSWVCDRFSPPSPAVSMVAQIRGADWVAHIYAVGTCPRITLRMFIIYTKRCTAVSTADVYGAP